MKMRIAVIMLVFGLLLCPSLWADNSCPSGYTVTECQSMGFDQGACPSGYSQTECEGMGRRQKVCPSGYSDAECESMGLPQLHDDQNIKQGDASSSASESSRKQCRGDVAGAFQKVISHDFHGTEAYGLEPDVSEWQGNVAKVYDTVVDPAKGFRAVAVYEVTIDPNCYVITRVKRDL